jgi:DNA polymerase III subunit epsilon
MPFSNWRDWLAPSPRWDQAVFWALDLETTGLDPAADRIITVGMVPIRGGIIRYGERYRQLVKPEGLDDLSTDGIRAHHILPAELSGAPAPDEILPAVDARIREGVLLVHYAPLDLRFLRAAYRRARMVWPGPRVVDTVELVLRWHHRQQQWIPHPLPPRAGLSEARASFHLPEYPAHDALVDAVATAELFLALRHALRLETLRAIH